MGISIMSSTDRGGETPQDFRRPGARVLTLTLDGTGETRELTSGTLAVGRAHQDNGWVLPDPGPSPTVSRWHCSFAVGPEGATVTDLRSTNGTQVDGQALVPHRPMPLQGGEVIEIGPWRMLVGIVEQWARHDPGPPPPPTPGPAPGRFGPDAPLPSLWSPGQVGFTRAAPDTCTGHPSVFDLFAEDEAPAGPRSLGGNGTPAESSSGDLPPVRQGSDPTDTPERPRATGAPQEEAMLTPRHAALRGSTETSSPSLPDAGPSTFDPLGPLADPLVGPWWSTPDPGPAAPMSVAGGVQDDDPFGLGPREVRSADPAPPPSQTIAQSPEPADEGEQQADAPAPRVTALPDAGDVAGSSRTRPGDPSGAALLAAFLDGAGLEGPPADGRSPEVFFREAGQVFARLADGLRELLAVRAVVKGHVRLDRTQISASFNNRLKLSINGREATAALLGQGQEGYLAPLAAVDAGFRDLKVHEMAILEGVQSAVEELLELFAPAALEGRLDDAGMLTTLIQGGRRARLWELYQERYGEIAGAARMRFMGSLDDAFRSAYARKVAEMSVPSPSPAEPPPGVPRS